MKIEVSTDCMFSNFDPNQTIPGDNGKAKHIKIESEPRGLQLP